MAIFNSLTFAGVNSLDYGIYITGEAVYNAPTRSVEMVSIPGRDGDLVLDNGHFENIEVTYPAGCFGDDQTAFATRVRNFRNAVASKLGYQRLTDTYNTNEYRLALFVGGLEVEPVSYGRAGEFELVFNCKPFRYLTSGSNYVPWYSGDKITNPTRFDAQPILRVYGSGTITMNGHIITLNDQDVGDVDLIPNQRIFQSMTSSHSDARTMIYLENTRLMEDGDSMTLDSMILGVKITPRGTGTLASVSASVTGDGPFTSSVEALNGAIYQTIKTPEYTYTYGNGTEVIKTISSTVSYTAGGTSYTTTWSMTLDYRYDTVLVIESELTTLDSELTITLSGLHLCGQSTQSVLGSPTYIDCELGEVYKIVVNDYISLNKYVELASDLPVLSPGENTIRYGSTVTSLRVAPRWRQL